MLPKHIHLDVSPTLQHFFRIKLGIFESFINYFKPPVIGYSIWILYTEKL